MTAWTMERMTRLLAELKSFRSHGLENVPRSVEDGETQVQQIDSAITVLEDIRNEFSRERVLASMRNRARQESDKPRRPRGR